MKTKQEVRVTYADMLRDLAAQIECGAIDMRQVSMHSPVAQFAPPGASFYEGIHTGEFTATLELAWEKKEAVDAYWEKVNSLGGLLPARVI